MEKVIAILRKLGLNRYESKAYLALASSGVSTAGKLAEKSGIPRAKIYEVLRSLESDHRSLDLMTKRLLADEPGEAKLLLVVDQFEEVFALCHDEAERGQFIDALVHAVAAEDGRTVVVPTAIKTCSSLCSSVLTTATF